MRDALQRSVRDALETLMVETGSDADQLFGERVVDYLTLSVAGSHAAGFIEGAALALGLTVLEFLDELGLPSLD